MQGPRLYRFFNYVAPEYFQAPTGGWNPDANPWELPPNQAPVLDNFLVRPGRIQVRGAFTNWADLSSIAPVFLSGIHQQPGSTKLLIGRKNTSSTATVDQQFAPIVRPTASASLATGNTTLQVAAGGTTLTTIAGTADQIPGPRGIDFQGIRYYLSAFSAGAAVQDSGSTYFVLPTSLNTFSGAGAVATQSNAPHGSIDIKAYQSRIWLLAGINTPGAGTTFDPNSLFFTRPLGDTASPVLGSPLGNLGTDWKDPVSGSVNYITIDGNINDPCTGLATVRNGLLVFRYGSIYILRGSTTATYQLTPMSREVGCFDARSIVEADKGVYFLSKKGLMVTNGTTVVNVSGAAMYTLQNAVSVVLTSIKAGLGGYATCALASDGQILVSLGISSVTSGALDGHWQPVWCGLFDPSQHTWTRITSSLFASDGTIIVSGNNYPAWTINTPTPRLITIGDKYITQLEAEAATVPTPVSAGPNIAGAGADDSSHGGNVAWFTPGKITTEDGLISGASLFTGDTSHTLVSSSHGFSIPVNATVTGIKVEAKVFCDQHASPPVAWAGLFLYKAGVEVGTNHSPGTALPASLTWQSYGGSTDLWGTTWTSADINNSGFGAGIQITAPTAGTTTAGSVDAVRITVYYTIPSVSAPQSFVQTSALYDKDASGNYQPIPAMWSTHIAPIVGTTALRKKAEMMRFYIDHVLQGAGLPSTNGWTLALTDQATGATVTTASIAPTNSSVVSSSVSGGNLKQSLTIERNNVDDYHEVQDPAFTLSWQDTQQSSAPPSVVAEVYGVGFEVQKTSQRR